MLSILRCRLNIPAVVLLALLAGLALARPEDRSRRIAVLVGVKAYNHADLPDLEFTERDVTELGDLLRPAGYQVTLLTTTAGANDARRKPTLANIRRELAAALQNVTKYDTVLIGLAGHGVQPAGAKGSYFCPSDAKPKDPHTLLSLAGLIDQLNDSGVGVKLLLVDACRNDPDPGRGRGVDGSRIEALPKGVAALFSCSAGQRSFETKKAGGGHGVFFHFVLEGLRGQAAKEGGEVTWSRLADYVQENVARRVPEWIGAEVRQVPHEVKNLAGLPPVLLSLKKEIGFKPLFNGKDLSGWSVYGGGRGQWKVVDGAIVSAGPASYLFSERGDYHDFHLRVEALVNDGGDSGVFFRTLYRPEIPPGYEAQINATPREPFKTGTLYFPTYNPQVAVKELLHRPGEWFTEEVIAAGNHLLIKVNGKTTVDWRDSNHTYTGGHFALQQHDERTVVKFRKIEVKELPAAKK
jgi:hypothetical protein